MAKESWNPAIEDDPCPTCKGWGWNRALRRRAIHIQAPVHFDNLKTIAAYIRSRLCCPECNGYGIKGGNRDAR